MLYFFVMCVNALYIQSGFNKIKELIYDFNVYHLHCVNKTFDHQTTILYTSLYYSNLKSYVFRPYEKPSSGSRFRNIWKRKSYIHLRISERESWLWVSRKTATCSFLDYYNKELCRAWLFYCYVAYLWLTKLATKPFFFNFDGLNFIMKQ